MVIPLRRTCLPTDNEKLEEPMPLITRRSFTGGLAALSVSLLAAPRAFAQAGAFPVTIKHALGETTLEKAPQRVVTIGWITQDAVVALDAAPVAVPQQAWGGDDNKILPWLTEALAQRGMAMPERINFDTEIPYEQVLALEPDAILAFYSGLTQEQYDRLSAIAPVVAYPDKPWANNWQDITRSAGQALGKIAEAQALIDKTNGLVDAAAAAHPQFKGKTFTFASAWVGEPGINVYTVSDPRVQLVEQLGLVPSDGAKALSVEPGYFKTVSFENLASVDADVVIFLDEGDEASDAIYKTEAMQRFAPIAAGHILRMTDHAFVMATSAPSVLAIPWMLERFVPQLAEVVG